MYIAPNSTIKILRNVPLDITYDHTIYFDQNASGLSAQANYFISNQKYSLSSQSYQRVKRGWIRVGIDADNLYDCNYLMFQNTSYGTKWFYAFIKSVEYINNAVSEIEFEIDVMQTWNGDYTLDKCFVDREHTAAGDTLSYYTDENIDVGNLIYGAAETFDMNDMHMAIISTPRNNVSGHVYYNTYFGANVTTIFPVTSTNVTNIDSYINQLTDANETILAIYQYPSKFASGIEGQSPIYDVGVSVPGTVDGSNPYTPKNKKLLYYPYSFIRVSAQNGKYQDYPYELFDTTCNFRVECIKIPEAIVVVYPLYYKNKAICYEEKMTVGDFPVCAWSVDSFERWWSNNKQGIFYDGMSRCISSLTGVPNSANNSEPQNAPKNPVASNAGFVDYALSTGTQMAKAVQAPNNVYGNTTTGNLNAGLGQQKIVFYRMSLQRERAIMIDDYFDRYGYACKRAKIPNRNVRPHWTYTKTIGCTITGSVPADDMRMICDIYNNGITFWRYGNEVGNYFQDNTVSEG